jgi:hypothetical protein
MILVSILSSVAIAFGIGANLPQISRMLRTRSAAGQSPIGWVMGAVTNLCLAYVNLVGLGALFLGVANLGTVILCSIAVALTLRFGGGAAEAPAVAAVAPGTDTMIGMPTQEFALLHEAIHAAEQHRSAWRAQQPPVHEDAQPANLAAMAMAS